jgi:hypothetical protein
VIVAGMLPSGLATATAKSKFDHTSLATVVGQYSHPM